MKVNFSKVVSDHNGIPINHGFVIKIDNYTSLIDYWMRVRTGMVATGFYNYVRSKEYAKLCNHPVPSVFDHVRNKYGEAISILAEIKGNPGGVIGLLGDFENRILKDQIEMINEHGAIYINHNGGYFPHNDKVKITDVVMREEYVFPKHSKEDIEILKFRGGKHYYAKIGGTDVVWRGKQKWNTHDAAESAALNFLEKKNEA